MPHEIQLPDDLAQLVKDVKGNHEHAAQLIEERKRRQLVLEATMGSIRFWLGKLVEELRGLGSFEPSTFNPRDYPLSRLTYMLDEGAGFSYNGQEITFRPVGGVLYMNYDDPLKRKMIDNPIEQTIRYMAIGVVRRSLQTMEETQAGYSLLLDHI